MGLIGRIIGAVRAAVSGVNFLEIQIDPGGGASFTGEHFANPGDDSNPLNADVPVAVKMPGNGRYAVVGYIDTKNAGVTAAGEKRIYARNPAGVIVNQIYLRADGSIEAGNALGSFIVGADGSINLNGVIITPTGEIQAPGNVIAGTIVPATQVSLLLHTHTSAAPGNPTSPPTPGT